MKWIKLFDSYRNYTEYSRMKKNLLDMFVELQDDNLMISVHNSKYTQENLDRIKKHNPYNYKETLFFKIKEPSMVLNILISSNNGGVDESGEYLYTYFPYKRSYDDNIEMANEYVKSIYNLTDSDIVYRINQSVKDRSLLTDGNEFMSIEVCYIIKGEVL